MIYEPYLDAPERRYRHPCNHVIRQLCAFAWWREQITVTIMLLEERYG